MTVTKEIGASPERVYALWLDKTAMMQWFGIDGFTNTGCAIEARVGAPWHMESRAPDGTPVRMEGEVLALEEGRRILQSWRSVEPDGRRLNETEAEILFEPVAGGTRVTVHHRKIRRTPEMFEAGWHQSLDRIARLAT